MDELDDGAATKLLGGAGEAPAIDEFDASDTELQSSHDRSPHHHILVLGRTAAVVNYWR